jgi:hypothetical protein
MRAILATLALLLAAASTHASDAALESCRAKLKQAQQLDVLTDLQWKGPRLHVVAGRTYYTMPFHAKEGFADTINCFAMAGKSGCLSFDILNWNTGKATDRYSGCKLKPL